MNGVYDVGGMHGLGRVKYEASEPVFHAAWEKSVFGLCLGVLGSGLVNLDEIRHGAERMNPAHYFASRYYEHWLSSIERNLIEKGIVSERDLDARTQRFLEKPDARPKRTENPELSARVLGFVRRGFSTRMPTRRRPRFRVGDRVLARNLNPKGHTRLPRYARGKRGKVARVYDAFIYPNTHAHGLGRNPQILYSVRFDGRELWGADAEPRTCAYLDMWEDYLEPA